MLRATRVDENRFREVDIAASNEGTSTHKVRRAGELWDKDPWSRADEEFDAAAEPLKKVPSVRDLHKLMIMLLASDFSTPPSPRR